MNNTHVTNIVTINGSDYRIISRSFDGIGWNAVNVEDGTSRYVSMRFMEYLNAYDDFPPAPQEKCYVL